VFAFMFDRMRGREWNIKGVESREGRDFGGQMCI
jgi:hypothetical protein